MANKVTLKRSSVVGKIPQTTDLDFGEVALNFADGRLYFKNSSENIEFFDSGKMSDLLPPFAANEADFGNVLSSPVYKFDLGETDKTEIFSFNLGDLETEEFSIFDADANFGSVTGSTKTAYDLGNVSSTAGETYDLGSVVTSVLSFPERFVLPQSTVSSLTNDGITGEMRFVTDDTSGPTPVFYDGTNWKRLADNQIVESLYIENGYVENGYV